MDRSWTVAAASVSILLAGGCGERDVVCLAEPVYGMVLRVRDSASGEPAAAGAYAVARDRNNLVILYRLESDPLQFRGVGIPGVYDVAVTKPGYLTWARSDVAVADAGPCSIGSVTLDVSLQRGAVSAR